MDENRLGYPTRTLVAFATLLAVGVLLGVLPLERGPAWVLSAIAIVIGIGLLVWQSRRLARARAQTAPVLAALGSTTADLPLSLRVRMPLVLVIGDALEQLFDRDGTARLAHVGDGAIWLRVEHAQDLPALAVALRQWRDGRAPDGVVLALAPALHVDDDALAQALRLARQAVSDASRLLGAPLPSYVAIYQRVTSAPAFPERAPVWYGLSSTTRLPDASRFASVIQAAAGELRYTSADRRLAWRAAGLIALIGWTERAVLRVLLDARLPASRWPLFGAAWIDVGPAGTGSGAWAHAVQLNTRVTLPAFPASDSPWPLPQSLVSAMPQRRWQSPRWAALAHALGLLACAAAVAGWGAAKNNQTLIGQVGAHLHQFTAVPLDHDTARRAALQVITADRDRLDQYQRTGVPLRLDLGMYRGAALLPALNASIASYVTPAPPPSMVTLDSMSLFDSGRAVLKPGSTRAMVGALELIKTHPNKRILVAGYTDSVGNPASNQALSVARANAVRDWLVDAAGIPVSRFPIQGYGQSRPIADNQTPDGRAHNRRVEITLVPDNPGN